MTVQEMFQEMVDQSLEDLLMGYTEALEYDDRGEIVEIECSASN